MGKIVKVSGPLVVASGLSEANMADVVRVGEQRLIGEILTMSGDSAAIQVYEETSGLGPGAEVVTTGAPLSVELGPGLIENIYDGIQRPLRKISEQSGSFIARGCTADGIDPDTLWDVTVTAKVGDTLGEGEVYATCPETPSIIHKVMVPPGVSGKVTYAAESGHYTVNSKIIELTDESGKVHTLTLCSKWPIRTPRPISKRLPCTVPLITGQRVIDTLLPVAKGGTAAIPGGFGTGKTMTQHQLAKWCDADMIIYVGCGERGNEMTQVLDEFGELIDPRTGRKLTDRTVLIANTSNMPVAAREASIYTGITLAEYYRDMGYAVAMMADSTSRWAEALREISGRLEEMLGRQRRLRHGHRRGLTARLGFLRTRHSEYKALHPCVLGARQVARLRKALPRHQLD